MYIPGYYPELGSCMLKYTCITQSLILAHPLAVYVYVCTRRGGREVGRDRYCTLVCMLINIINKN